MLFEPYTTKFSLTNALTCAELSELVYAQTWDEIANKLEAQALEYQFIEDMETDTELMVVSSPQTILVIFRGTESEEDVFTDANCGLYPFAKSNAYGNTKGRVHWGFRYALESVWDRLKITLEAFQNGHKSLFFTGHSLGAALATLAVARLRLVQDKGVFGLYTFGSPRVGDDEWAKGFDADFAAFHHRFVNNNDIVTRIVPRALNYSHCGTFLYLDHEGQLQTDIGYWWLFLDRIKGEFDHFRELLWGQASGLDCVEDHFIRNYVQRIQHLKK